MRRKSSEGQRCDDITSNGDLCARSSFDDASFAIHSNNEPKDR